MNNRFGQFAQKGFGASLSHASPGAPGVLPQPQGSPSASALPPQSPQQRALGPGLLPQGNNDRGTMFLAQGGVIPDDSDQDSGNAQPADTSPFTFIQQALNYGRKTLGLPQQFYMDKPKPSNDADATQQAMKDEGVDMKGSSVSDPSVREFQNNNIMNNYQPDEQGQWGDTTIQGKEKTAYLAQGGEVDEGTGVADPSEIAEPMGRAAGNGVGVSNSDAGVIPDGSEQEQPEQQGPGQDPQSIMKYLSGQGGVPPEVAQALEQQVDPQGQMPESLRKMHAIAKAGSPDKAFQVMQHYRQKFNAYTAFAEAAIQGSGGRPPNPQAAADALNKAYDNVPDGNEMRFTPTQGGVQVNVRKLAGKQQPQEDDTQSFAEGGEVEEGDYATPEATEVDWRDKLKSDIGLSQYGPEGRGTDPGSPEDYATPGASEPDDSGEDWETRKRRRAERLRAGGDKVAGVIGNALSPTEGEAEGYKQIGAAAKAAYAPIGAATQGISDAANGAFRVGWNKLKELFTKDASFDKLVESGGDFTPPQEKEGSLDPGAPAAAAPGGRDAMAQGQPGSGPGPDQGPQQDNPAAALASPTKAQATQIGVDAANKVKEYDQSYKDGMHMIDQAFGTWLGRNEERQMAKLAFHQNWMNNNAKVEAEQTKSTRAENVARIGANSRERVAGTNAEARQRAVELTTSMRSNDNFQRIVAKAKLASDANDQKEYATQIGLLKTIVGASMTNAPGLADDPKAMEAVTDELLAHNGIRGLRAPVRTPGPQQGQLGAAPTTVAPPQTQQPQPQPQPQQGATEGVGAVPQAAPPPGMKYQANSAGTKWRLVPAQ